MTEIKTSEIRSQIEEIIELFKSIKPYIAKGYRYAQWKETTQTNNDTIYFDTIQPKGGTITRKINPVKGKRLKIPKLQSEPLASRHPIFRSELTGIRKP